MARRHRLCRSGQEEEVSVAVSLYSMACRGGVIYLLEAAGRHNAAH